ncbi:MAG: carbon-nitrogen hydrolase family protein [Candidatus Omnitrophota bacterium]|nr:carbon-nitrogen hydrolase family protein [Candidatus Omnitrophota bacterium]
MAPSRDKSKFRVACIQTKAGKNFESNWRRIKSQISAALRKQPHLIALPEAFSCRAPRQANEDIARRQTPFLIREFTQIAKKNRVAFLMGSVLESSKRRGKFYNTSLLISETGRVVARYRKIHLFDIGMKGRVRTRESSQITPGNRVVVGTVWGVRVGLSICYDLRFPELFRALAQKGSRIIFMPANFTYFTGKAHWEVLLRARAIENQAYVVAPAQAGSHPATGIKSFGCSLLVDPWGKVLRRAARAGEQVLCADLDLRYQARIRREFPVLTHRRL